MRINQKLIKTYMKKGCTLTTAMFTKTLQCLRRLSELFYPVPNKVVKKWDKEDIYIYLSIYISPPVFLSKTLGGGAA